MGAINQVPLDLLQAAGREMGKPEARAVLPLPRVQRAVKVSI